MISPWKESCINEGKHTERDIGNLVLSSLILNYNDVIEVPLPSAQIMKFCSITEMGTSDHRLAPLNQKAQMHIAPMWVAVKVFDKI